jgi:hypothetical protein
VSLCTSTTLWLNSSLAFVASSSIAFTGAYRPIQVGCKMGIGMDYRNSVTQKFRDPHFIDVSADENIHHCVMTALIRGEARRSKLTQLFHGEKLLFSLTSFI